MTLLELDFGVTLDEDLADDEDTLPDSTLDEDVFPFKSGAMGSPDSPLHATNKAAERNNVAKYFKESLLDPRKNCFCQIYNIKTGITLVIPNPCGTIEGFRGRSPLGEGVAENAKGGCSEGDSSPYIQRKLPAGARSVLNF